MPKKQFKFKKSPYHFFSNLYWIFLLALINMTGRVAGE